MSDSAMSLDIAKALLEPEPSTTLPTRSSIEVAEALLEPPPTAEFDGDSDGPESLTVISEVKKGAAASESFSAVVRDTTTEIRYYLSTTIIDCDQDHLFFWHRKNSDCRSTTDPVC